METIFTPYQSLGGGALIGIATIFLMWTLGRIMGATGVLAGFLYPSSLTDWTWRAVLLLGMFASPFLYQAVMGEFPPIQVPIGKTMLIIGGLIVGVGVTLGGGCTSGHGICGIARLSPRSIVATVNFMIFTAITVYIIRHIIGA